MPRLAVLVALLALTGLMTPAGADTGGTEGSPHVVAPVDGAVERPFEQPAHTYGAGHRGVKLTAEGGTPVAAALGGTVRFSGTVAETGWVSIDHGDGRLTAYGPLEPRIVRAGAWVAAGDELGRLADGARAVHWSLRVDGVYVDPLSLLGHWSVHLVPVDEEPIDLTPVVDPAPDAASRFVWPVHGRISSPFGPRLHPVHGDWRLHTGIDVAAPTGTPVIAAAAGTVSAVGWRGGYGLTVDVDHGGTTITRYAHLSSTSATVGQSVAAGERLGAVGCTGTCTGPHLHFEVRRAGAPTDPLAWLGPA